MHRFGYLISFPVFPLNSQVIILVDVPIMVRVYHCNQNYRVHHWWAMRHQLNIVANRLAAQMQRLVPTMQIHTYMHLMNANVIQMERLCSGNSMLFGKLIISSFSNFVYLFEANTIFNLFLFKTVQWWASQQSYSQWKRFHMLIDAISTIPHPSMNKMTNKENEMNFILCVCVLRWVSGISDITRKKCLLFFQSRNERENINCICAGLNQTLQKFSFLIWILNAQYVPISLFLSTIMFKHQQW